MALVKSNTTVEERVLFFDKKFRDYYEEGHLILARHAAFPVSITVDLLYQIWANFKSYTSRWDTHEVIPYLAVSDLLLSSLFRQTGSGIYEMEGEVRTYLLTQLKSDERFGEGRIRELASFLYQYASSVPDRPEWKNFKEAQRLTAVLAVDATAATQDVLRALAEKVKAGRVNSSIGIVNMIESFSKDHTAFGDELTKRLQPKEATSTLAEAQPGMDFQKSLILDDVPRAGAVPLKINLPAHISDRLQGVRQAVENERHDRNSIRKIQAFLIGISEYKAKGLNLTEPVDDVHKMGDCLEKLYNCSVDKLLNEQAVKEKILMALHEKLQDAGPDDLLLFYFGGHADNKGQNHRLVLWDYPDNVFEVKNESDYYITEKEFRGLLDLYASNNPHVILILDTHSGSNGWIDRDNPKHIALMASHVEELVYELPEKGGIFTTALCETLIQATGRISYRHLCHEVFKKLDALLLKEVHKVQTPKFYLHEQGWDRLFLSTKQSKVQEEMQDLLQQAGYSDPRKTMGFEKNLSRFLNDHSIEDDRKAFHYLQLKKEVLAAKKLTVLSIGNKYETEREYNHFFVQNFNRPECEISFAPLPGSSNELPSQAIVNLQRIVQAQVLIIGIDRSLLTAPLNSSSLGKLLARGCAYNKEIVLMLEEDIEVAGLLQKEYSVFHSNIRTVRLHQEKPLLKQAVDAIAQRLIRLLETGTANVRADFDNLWEVGASIKIYFINGTAVQRDKVKRTAVEWTRYANLYFFFTNERQESDMRITFKGEGAWSYEGTKCMTISKEQPTMCLSYVTTKPQLSKDEKGAILRQFGFAIGLKHEHQNPNREIEWDKEAVYKEFMGTPNNWSKATVDRQLFETYPATSKPFDPKSIMMNPIEKRLTLNGFSSEWITDLSDMDKQFIALLYPRVPTPADTSGSTNPASYVSSLDVQPPARRSTGTHNTAESWLKQQAFLTAHNTDVAASMFIKEGKEQVFLVDKSLVLFTSEVSKQNRSYVLNAILLAQLAANKKISYNVDLWKWYETFTEVLSKVGWNIEAQELVSLETSKNPFEMEKIIVDILTSAWGSQSMPLLLKALNAIKTTSLNDRRMMAFEKATHSLTKGCFQLTLVTEQHNSVSMQSEMFQLTSLNKINRILFFTSKKDGAKLQYTGQHSTLNSEIYRLAHDAVQQKLGANIGAYVAQIDIDVP